MSSKSPPKGFLNGANNLNFNQEGHFSSSSINLQDDFSKSHLNGSSNISGKQRGKSLSGDEYFTSLENLNRIRTTDDVENQDINNTLSSNSNKPQNRPRRDSQLPSNVKDFLRNSAYRSTKLDYSIPPKTAPLRRRASLDTVGQESSRKFLVNVDATLKSLLEREDTNKDREITIEDSGPKVFTLGTANSNGFNKADIRGTYMLSNLLKELDIAKSKGLSEIIIDESCLNENPVDRLQRIITNNFWPALTRRLDSSLIEVAAADSKNRNEDKSPRIYIPKNLKEQFDYYMNYSNTHPNSHLDVKYLPSKITPEWLRDSALKPGILALAMEKVPSSPSKSHKYVLRGVPFVVPGGRFNEMYGWDSYMISLGLLTDGHVDLAKSMVINFCFEIKHYGKILNANRSYYLLRSQPPFLTDMTLRVYDKIRQDPDSLEFLRKAISYAIKEYDTVWMASPRYDPVTGLSRYRPEGLGIPPETEPSHFINLLTPYAKKYNMTLEEFEHAYNYREVSEPELDTYFLHDRAVRESGHDTTYRFEGVCADLATIDLNSLLYKYETDIEFVIRTIFNDKLELDDGIESIDLNGNRTRFESSARWKRAATKRRERIDKYLWNESKGMYFDYNTLSKQQHTYESATTFWALWAGVASPRQASLLVSNALPKFETLGGLVSGTESSRGKVGLDRPNRQWDYPFGWAPQQMLAWIGLERYGYLEDAERLAYRWLYLITKSFVDYNGVVVEKYNVTNDTNPHRVTAEYGNQGNSSEGFGWVNASFLVGLNIIDSRARRALGACTPPDTFFNAQRKLLEKEAEIDDEEFNSKK